MPIDKYIKCIYCNELHLFSLKDYEFHYQDSIMRCPKPIPNDKIECFTCGEGRKVFFFKDELNCPYKRCRNCQKMGKITRHQTHNYHVKFREEMFIDAIRKCDKDEFMKYIKHSVNVNYVIQDTLTKEEKKIIGCEDFKEFNNKFNIHSYDRLWDRFGKPIPSRFNYSNTHPTTPLKVLIDCLEENKNNEENLVIYFNMTKVLLVNGADAKSSLIYFLRRYPDFNMDENNNNYNILFKAIGLIISLSCQGMIM